METYKDITEDKRSIVLQQMSETSDIGVKERLSEVLSHYPSAFDIEIELQFHEGCDFDDEIEDTPPRTDIVVRAVSPIWGPVEACFSQDEVPLLVDNLADDDLFLHALEDYNRVQAVEFKKIKAILGKMHERQVAVWKTLNVKHFVIIRTSHWVPVAVHRAISFKQASKNAIAAGYPPSEYACTEVRRSVYQRMVKKLPKIADREPEPTDVTS